MGSNASEFNKSRLTINALTKKRVKFILSYVLECHKLLLEDKVEYSLSEIKKSKIKPENKFRNYFVDNYLRKNSHLLNFSNTDEFTFFDKESEETFTENNIEQTDKIDIYIRDKALSSSFGSNGNVYFAIECKRIKIKSDSKEYVLDIEKFSKRSHIATRLPFEGQIAFIENNKLNHKLIKDEVNLILKQISTIKTDLFLQQEKLHSSIDGTYLSKHRRNFNQKSFSIYHLMLDYSKVVIS